MTGGSAGDVLAGGGGDDTIEGGADFDSLFGNGGSGTFVFNGGSDVADIDSIEITATGSSEGFVFKDGKRLLG